jgi:hypothetical protein
MRVVHVRADRPGDELVGERFAGLDRVLGDVRHAVHLVRQLLTVEVDPGRLVKVVLEDGPDRVAFDDVEPGAGPGAVEPERRESGLLRVGHVADLVDREVEHLDAAVHLRREGLIAGSLDLGGFAVEEPFHDRQGGGIMVGGSCAA